MSKRKSMTIAIKGNSFGNQYARGGLKEYYSVWRVVLRYWGDNFKPDRITVVSSINLLKVNLTKHECSKKSLANGELLKESCVYFTC